MGGVAESKKNKSLYVFVSVSFYECTCYASQKETTKIWKNKRFLKRNIKIIN